MKDSIFILLLWTLIITTFIFREAYAQDKSEISNTPRLVTYKILGDFEPGEIKPDLITLNGERVDGKNKFFPAKYLLRVWKKGYKPKEHEEVITPGHKPYIIREDLVSLPRKIKLDIRAVEWPEYEIEVESIAFNGKQYRGNPINIKPGEYEMDISYQGFFSLNEKIVIPPDQGPFVIKRTLKCIPVPLEEKITFNEPPGDLGTDYKIEIAPWEDKYSLREIRKGETMTPGEYRIVITKPAYRDIDEKLRILPREKPFTLEYELEAKPVRLICNIDHNVPPPSDLGECMIAFVNVKRDYPVNPNKDMTNEGIKPGHYRMFIAQPGYQEIKKEVKIAPSPHPFEIREKLIAQKRPISFKVGDTCVNAIEILVNGNKITPYDLFQPGINLDLTIKLENYQTIQKRMKIIPGPGEFCIWADFKELTKYEIWLLNIKVDSIELDEIEYPFEYYADNHKIEHHHIKKNTGVNNIHLNIKVPIGSKNFKIAGGYLYNQVRFEEINKVSADFDRIDAVKLINHLEQVKKSGIRSTLEAVNKLVADKDKEKLIKSLSSDDIARLVSYIEDLNPENADDIDIKNVILERLK